MRRVQRSILLAVAVFFFTAGIALLVSALVSSQDSPTEAISFGPDDSTLTGFRTQLDTTPPSDATEGAEEQLADDQPTVSAPSQAQVDETQPTGSIPSQASVTRLQAPSVEIDAPVERLGVDATGVMENPSGPESVGWYSFSAQPGSGSNAVFAGHLDYVDVGPAVFWRLRDLRPDDPIIVELQDGTAYTYSVVEARTFDAETAPVQDIVGPTEQEMITLITCAGSFDRGTRQYDQRLVVRAVRS